MKNTWKKWIGLVVMVAVAASLVALAGCSSPANNGSSSAGSEASNSSASMANPWSDAASAEEAAKGAGLDAFALPEGEIADLGKPIEVTYRFMDGMAEARYELPASSLTVRTATISPEDSLDISGDYNTYSNEWTETIANKQIACAGNRKGDSTKTYWGEEDADRAHSNVAEGLGGDEDFGLNTERLTVFVEAMK